MIKKLRVRLFGILLTLLIFASATSVIAAASCKTHSYLPWKTAQSASCTGTGLKTRQCRNCGTLQKSTIPKLGHSSVTRTVVSATCQKTGKKECACSRCGKLISTTIMPQSQILWDLGLRTYSVRLISNTLRKKYSSSGRP